MNMNYGNNNIPPSVSQSKEPHRFFERFLDNDLSKMSKDLEERYELIKTAKLVGVTPVGPEEHWKQSNSISTMKWRQYNVFQFNTQEIYELFKSISSMTREACQYYGIDFDEQRYMVQGWFNITNKGMGKLDWHDHGGAGAPNFHGYYSVNAEPSITNYRVFDKDVQNHNVNNRAILSEMGHPHSMADWDWDGPRITVAYDIIPLIGISVHGVKEEQHWIPLL